MESVLKLRKAVSDNQQFGLGIMMLLLQLAETLKYTAVYNLILIFDFCLLNNHLLSNLMRSWLFLFLLLYVNWFCLQKSSQSIAKLLDTAEKLIT